VRQIQVTNSSRLSGLLVLACALLASVGLAAAQTIGGSTSISVTTTTTTPMALPASVTAYPALLLSQAPNDTVAVHFALSTSAAPAGEATTSSPLIPRGAICLNIGPNGFVSVIGSSSTTLYATQFTACPLF
jgi:hypothetical protein